MLHITFYECENRIAKYLEQLFLDTYAFYLNSEENRGSGSLYARWEEERLVHGTELYSMAEAYARVASRHLRGAKAFATDVLQSATLRTRAYLMLMR